MLKSMKAQAIPTVVLIGEIILSSYAPGWLVGLLVGFTAFWLLWSLVFDKKVVKRYPWLREWLPFVAASDELSSTRELMHRHIEGMSFRIVDIAVNGIVDGRTFDDCIIYGPAIVAAQGFTAMRDPHWLSPRGDIWCQIDDKKVRAGMIVLKDCTFNRCKLHDIGVAGDDREAFFQNMTVQQDPQPSQVGRVSPPE